MVRKGQKEGYRGKWGVVLQEVQWEGRKKEKKCENLGKVNKRNKK